MRDAKYYSVGLGLAAWLAGAPGAEKEQLVHIYVEPFQTADAQIGSAELHRIAEELFVNTLAATKKFVFAKNRNDAGVELVLTASVARSGGDYLLELTAGTPGGTQRTVTKEKNASLETIAEMAAEKVSALKKREGHVIKRSGNMIVIARGKRDGIAVGQRYKTTDTGEEFVIESVSTETATGKITASTGGARAIGSPLAVGSVDIVFVIDITGSMQEEIDGVLMNCERFASQLAGKGIDATLGLVTFRKGVVDARDLTADVAEFKSYLQPVRADLAANETPFEGLSRAMKSSFRPDAKRIFVLVTDEPAFDAILDVCGELGMTGGCMELGQETIYSTKGIAKRVTTGLQVTNSVVFPVALRDRQGIYVELAKRTGGVFYELKLQRDFTKLLDALGHKIEGMFQEM